MSIDLDFGSFEPIVLPVNILGENYLLREASGDAAARYNNAMLKCTTLGPDGRPARLDGLADVDPFLVSLCIVTATGKPVRLETVRSWPNRIVQMLAEKVKEISELGPKASAEAPKNDVTDTGIGSG